MKLLYYCINVSCIFIVNGLLAQSIEKTTEMHKPALPSTQQHRAISQKTALHAEQEICNHASMLYKNGDYSAAEERYISIINNNPHCARAHRGLAHALLAQEKFEHGWHEYEWRWIPISYDAYEIKEYIKTHGSLRGKRLLLKTEYGFGDIFQFLRYAQLLKDSGAYVMLLCHKKLVPLLSLCPYIDELHAETEPAPPYHMNAFIMSGPLIYGTIAPSIPAPIPYLYADQQLVDRWSTLIDKQKINIGICWQADLSSNDSAIISDAYEKSIPLSVLVTIATAHNVCVHSLQKQCSLPDQELLEHYGIKQYPHLDEKAGSFMDTAALMTHLDLIISIDTSVAHLAGALGRPTWLLLQREPDWRWPRQGCTTPWYPTMRLFRQTSKGNWHDVIDDVIQNIDNDPTQKPYNR